MTSVYIVTYSVDGFEPHDHIAVEATLKLAVTAAWRYFDENEKSPCSAGDEFMEIEEWELGASKRTTWHVKRDGSYESDEQRNAAFRAKINGIFAQSK